MDNQQTAPSKKQSREMRAVLRIINTDQELQRKALPHVDIARESIDLPKIWANDFGGGHSGALCWAMSIWCDKVATNIRNLDPFDRAFSLDVQLQIAVIEALKIRWGLKS
jgi:hypothetical protein